MPFAKPKKRQARRARIQNADGDTFRIRFIGPIDVMSLDTPSLKRSTTASFEGVDRRSFCGRKSVLKYFEAERERLPPHGGQFQSRLLTRVPDAGGAGRRPIRAGARRRTVSALTPTAKPAWTD